MDKKLESIIRELRLLKYRNIKVYDVEEGGVSKFLVVATAINVNDNKKLCQQFIATLKIEEKIDGFHKGEWIIIDLEEIVIHLFASGFREKYNMDKLYKGKEINLDKVEKEGKKKNKV